ncbi:hypothetical protein BKA83DRAFT_91783 [Pisolithus microcarpus]|nr:hypothetical protein BKA83DRAFT_91783 [Pisolithus microcarpus]
MQPFAPNLQLVDLHAEPDTKNCSMFSYQVKPDLSVYSNNYSTGCDCSKIEICVEFKWDASLDAFDDPFIEEQSDIPSFVHPSKSAKDTLGQITAYASMQLGSQYCTHAFSVLVVQDTTCIIRWDWEGVIVTCPIKYGED